PLRSRRREPTLGLLLGEQLRRACRPGRPRHRRGDLRVCQCRIRGSGTSVPPTLLSRRQPGHPHLLRRPRLPAPRRHRGRRPQAEPVRAARPMSDAVTVVATDGAARAGTLRTAHGEVPTPAFMPVGTKGTVKTVDPDELRALGTPILLANTYHLYFRPGEDLIAELGGLHRFM